MLIPVQVTFRAMDSTADLDEYVKREAAKLERYYSRITSCRVIVEGPPRPEAKNPYHVRIAIGLPGGELVVRHEPNLHTALEDMRRAKSAKRFEAPKTKRDARRAVHEAFVEMRRQLEDYARKQRQDVKARSEPLVYGRIAKLFPESDYGFIEAPDAREVYFHRDSVIDGHFDRLTVGAGVGFAEEMGAKGPQATTVRLRHPKRKSHAPPSVVWPRTGRKAPKADSVML
ncbi:MAG: HPF/RaiA family ribosome-associated protein [Bryobacteraceae bacterium]